MYWYKTLFFKWCEVASVAIHFLCILLPDNKHATQTRHVDQHDIQYIYSAHPLVLPCTSLIFLQYIFRNKETLIQSVKGVNL